MPLQLLHNLPRLGAADVRYPEVYRVHVALVDHEYLLALVLRQLVHRDHRDVGGRLDLERYAEAFRRRFVLHLRLLRYFHALRNVALRDDPRVAPYFSVEIVILNVRNLVLLKIRKHMFYEVLLSQCLHARD